MAPWVIGVQDAINILNDASALVKTTKKKHNLILKTSDRESIYEITKDQLVRFVVIMESVCQTIHECDDENFNVFVTVNNSELPLPIKVMNDLC